MKTMTEQLKELASHRLLEEALQASQRGSKLCGEALATPDGALVQLDRIDLLRQSSYELGVAYGLRRAADIIDGKEPG